LTKHGLIGHEDLPLEIGMTAPDYVRAQDFVLLTRTFEKLNRPNRPNRPDRPKKPNRRNRPNRFLKRLIIDNFAEYANFIVIGG